MGKAIVPVKRSGFVADQKDVWLKIKKIEASRPASIAIIEK